MTVLQDVGKRCATRDSDIAERLLIEEWNLDSVRITMTGPSAVTHKEPETELAARVLLAFNAPVELAFLVFIDRFADVLSDAINQPSSLPGFKGRRSVLRERYGPAPGQLEAARALSRARRAIVWAEGE